MRIKFEVDNGKLKSIISVLDRIKLVMNGGIFGLMPALGKLVEQQHRKRITSEKTSPDGEAWPSNIRGTSVLYDTGALASGFKASTTLFSFRMGPPGLDYAYIQHFGGTMHGHPFMAFDTGDDFVFARKSVVPARPYMGISEANLAEIEILVNRHFQRGFGWL